MGTSLESPGGNIETSAYLDSRTQLVFRDFMTKYTRLFSNTACVLCEFRNEVLGYIIGILPFPQLSVRMQQKQMNGVHVLDRV